MDMNKSAVESSKMIDARALEQMALNRKVRVHDPFAEFLLGQPTMHSFDVSLLDCYRTAGHACHSITGAFLVTEAAIDRLFPETKVCERGDLMVEFGSNLDERATGPRSNVISSITGAWASSGFPGLKGMFKRKDLVSYGHSDLEKTAVRFRRLSTNKTLVVQYDSSAITSEMNLQLDFPESWRAEICAVLADPSKALKFF